MKFNGIYNLMMLSAVAWASTPGQNQGPQVQGNPQMNPEIQNQEHQFQQHQKPKPMARTPENIQAEIDEIRQNLVAEIDKLNASAVDKAPLENLKSAIQAEEGIDIKATIASALSGVDSNSAALVTALEQMAAIEEGNSDDPLLMALTDTAVQQALADANQRIAASMESGLTAEQLEELKAAQRQQSGRGKKGSRLNSILKKPWSRPGSEPSSGSSNPISPKKKTLKQPFFEEYKAAIAVAILLTTIIVASGVIGLLRYRKVI